MTQLEPGPELDAAVAKALGWKPTFTDKWERPEGGHTSLPPFSTDWNAAMQAAEAVGLFCDYLLGCGSSTGPWFLTSYDGGEHSHATGPEAICRAILALKGTDGS